MDNQNCNCNPNIQCSVDTCAYHAPENFCSLHEIKVGCCNGEAKKSDATECSSFQLGGATN